jgi:hypothetical protein
VTANISTRVTAALSALLLVLGLMALAASSSSGEISLVPTAAEGKGQPDTVPPEEPPCDADHGVPGQHAQPCQDSEPGDQAGDPPCDRTDAPPQCDGNGDNGDGTPECEEGEVYNEETEQCEEEGGNGTPQCEEGEVYNEETEQCEEEGGNGTPQCEEGEVYNEDTEQCEPDGAAASGCPDGALPVEIDGSPLAYVCVVLGPDEPDDDRACRDGALPIEIPGDPLAYACVVLGPAEGDDEDADEDAGEEEDDTDSSTLFGLL